MMARSQYIYVVEEHWDDGHRVAAAFTVKHELVTWLKYATGGDYRVTRLGDGLRSGEQISVLNIGELMA